MSQRRVKNKSGRQEMIDHPGEQYRPLYSTPSTHLMTLEPIIELPRPDNLREMERIEEQSRDVRQDAAAEWC